MNARGMLEGRYTQGQMGERERVSARNERKLLKKSHIKLSRNL
jgi:hypothetical protein